MSDESDFGFSVTSPFDAFLPLAQTTSGQRRSIDKAIDYSGPATNPLQKELRALAAAVQCDKWIGHCRKQVGSSFPSGLTYLSQLLAHDMVETLERFEVFDRNHRNMISTKLVLKSIYGDGPRGSRHLFRDGEFKIPNDNSSQIPRFYGELFDDGSHPLFADQRNRDNPILMQISTAFMQFHNLKFLEYKNILEKKGAVTSKKMQYIYARIANVYTWHNIILNEIIPKICKNVNGDLLSSIISSTKKTKGIMQNAAFRGFHSAVRDEYLFNEFKCPIKSNEMLSQFVRGAEFAISIPGEVRGWIEDWEVYWSYFFGNPLKIPNHASFTPSFAFSEKGMPISLFDFRSDILAAQFLPHDLITDRDKVRKFYQEISTVTGKDDQFPTLQQEVRAPLMLEYLIDGFYDHDPQARGKLGAISSEIFRHSITSAIAEANSEVNAIAREARLFQMPDPDRLPKSYEKMLEVIEEEPSNG